MTVVRPGQRQDLPSLVRQLRLIRNGARRQQHRRNGDSIQARPSVAMVLRLHIRLHTAMVRSSFSRTFLQQEEHTTIVYLHQPIQTYRSSAFYQLALGLQYQSIQLVSAVLSARTTIRTTTGSATLSSSRRTAQN